MSGSFQMDPKKDQKHVSFGGKKTFAIVTETLIYFWLLFSILAVLMPIFITRKLDANYSLTSFQFHSGCSHAHLQILEV